jgi:hypothetical protein
MGGDCTNMEPVVIYFRQKFQISVYNRTRAKEQKIIAPLQALGSKDAKEILIKLLRVGQKHADKDGCKHCDKILEVVFM